MKFIKRFKILKRWTKWVVVGMAIKDFTNIYENENYIQKIQVIKFQM